MEDALREKMAGEIALSSEPGKAIRKWREEFGISQHQLADAIGMSHSVISDYESGRRKSPGVQMVRKMIDAFIDIDKAAGSPTIRKYQPNERPGCIIDMGEFPEGVDLNKFIKAISGRNIGYDGVKKKIYGYTVVDSLKAIISLNSSDYMKIYGWSIERALIFTDVHFGRSPMVAIRAHPLTPAAVVYIQPDNSDPLAIKLAQLEKVPLIETDMEVGDVINKIKTLTERT
jgi:putative transcriptional regulator